MNNETQLLKDRLALASFIQENKKAGQLDQAIADKISTLIDEYALGGISIKSLRFKTKLKVMRKD